MSLALPSRLLRRAVLSTLVVAIVVTSFVCGGKRYPGDDGTHKGIDETGPAVGGWSVMNPGDNTAGYFNDGYRGKAAVPMARFGHTMVSIRRESALLVLNGYMYMYATSAGGASKMPSAKGREAGGPAADATSGPVYMGDTWVFTLATRQWARMRTTGSARPVPSFKLCSALLQADTVLVVGGDHGGGAGPYQAGGYVSHASLLNTSSWSWSPGGSIGVGRQGSSVSVVGGLVVIFGGMEASAEGGHTVHTNRIVVSTVRELLLAMAAEEVVPTWADVTEQCSGAPPEPRRAHGAVVKDSSIYIFGGHTTSGSLNDVWRLHVALRKEGGITCSWTREHDGFRGAAPSARGSFGLWIAEASIVVVGGAICTPGCTCLDDVWAFDTDTRLWSHRGSTGAFGRRHSFAAAGSRKGDLYLFGGESFEPYTYYNDVNRLRLAELVASPHVPPNDNDKKMQKQFQMPHIMEEENSPVLWESACDRIDDEGLARMCGTGVGVATYDHVGVLAGGAVPACCVVRMRGPMYTLFLIFICAILGALLKCKHFRPRRRRSQGL